MAAGEVLTRCGYRCDLCLAYRPNVERDDRRRLLSDGWSRYFGFRIPPERIVCDGCLSPGQPRLVDTGCPVRPCVIARGIANCASCGEYVCGKLRERIVDRAGVELRCGGPVPEADYQLFVRPYESRARLDALRDGTATASGDA
jgi:hypothetical protein